MRQVTQSKTYLFRKRMLFINFLMFTILAGCSAKERVEEAIGKASTDIAEKAEGVGEQKLESAAERMIARF